eukprot:Pgem_evm1s2481
MDLCDTNLTSTSQNKMVFEGNVEGARVEVFLDNGCSGLALMDYSLAYLLDVDLVELTKPIPVTLSDGSKSDYPVQFITKPITLSMDCEEPPTFQTGSNEFLEFKKIMANFREYKSNVKKMGRSNASQRISRQKAKKKAEAHRKTEAQEARQARETGRRTRADEATNLRNGRHWKEDEAKYAREFEELMQEQVELHDTLLQLHNLESMGIELCGVEVFENEEGIVYHAQVVLDKEYAKSTCTVDAKGIPKKYADYADVFAEDGVDEKKTNLPNHRHYDLEIKLVDGSELPKPQKIYPLSPIQLKALKEYIDMALAKGWISPSKSPLGAGCFFVPKPNGGLRLCINFRQVNDITVKDRYPVPLVDQLLNSLSGAKIYTRLDMPQAYHLLRIKKGDEWKTAFRTRFGAYQYNVGCFGLTNAPATFQRFLNDIFKDKDESTHEDHVRKF